MSNLCQSRERWWQTIAARGHSGVWYETGAELPQFLSLGCNYTASQLTLSHSSIFIREKGKGEKEGECVRYRDFPSPEGSSSVVALCPCSILTANRPRSLDLTEIYFYIIWAPNVELLSTSSATQRERESRGLWKAREKMTRPDLPGLALSDLWP